VQHPQCCGLLPDDPDSGSRTWSGSCPPPGAFEPRVGGIPPIFERRLPGPSPRVRPRILNMPGCWSNRRSPAQSARRPSLLPGIAFAEPLTNAVEHGNLELDSSLKDEPSEDSVGFTPNGNGGCGAAVRPASGPGERSRDGARRPPADPASGSRLSRSRANPRLPGHQVSRPYGYGLRMIESTVDEMQISDDGRT